jgi:hypothetical protein
MLRISYILSLALERSRSKQAYVEYASQSNGLSRNHCRNKRRSLSLDNTKHREIRALRETRSNGRIFATKLARIFRYCNC